MGGFLKGGETMIWSETEVVALLELNKQGLNAREIAEQLTQQFSRTFTRDSVKNKRFRLLEMKPQTTQSIIEHERNRQDTLDERTTSRQLVKEIIRKDKELQVALDIKGSPQTYRIIPKKHGKVEAAAIIVMSDWHIEETVKPGTVSGMNEFNEEIANQRIQRFFNNSIELLDIVSSTTDINKVILALLGDFISGSIHDSLMEGNWCQPTEAIIWVEQRIIGGFKAYLERTDHEFVVVCHSGNHARITEKKHISTQYGNSLETIMYHHIRHYFKDEPRMKFIIAEGYLTFLELGDKVIRFHHGDGFRYNGGVGDIYPAAIRWITRSNSSRYADYDVFGHHHGYRNGGNFTCNDSLIGYTAYAAERGFPFRRPAQRFFLYTTRGEEIASYPIFLD